MTRVLVVDSQPELCAVVKRTLEETGEYRVGCAFDGDEGARLLKRERPDLVILDAILPGMPGIELVARATERGIPIIVTTDEAKLDLRLLRLGWPHLRKPFREQQLLAECRSARAEVRENLRIIRASLERLLKTRGQIKDLVARLSDLRERVVATLAVSRRLRQ